jgi:hypothetical protein
LSAFVHVDHHSLAAGLQTRTTFTFTSQQQQAPQLSSQHRNHPELQDLAVNELWSG